MAIPGQTITILKNGVGVTKPAATNMIVLAPADSETSTGIIRQIASTQTAINLYGYTPIAEYSSYIAKYAGQCFALDLPATRTKVTTATMTKVGTSASAITIDGYATNDYDVVITIGDGYTYMFSLDGGLTTSKTRRITTGGSFVLPGSGLTITFGTSTGYVSGDTFTYAAVGPKFAASDLTAAFTTIKNYAVEFFAVVVYDGLRTAANSAALSVALEAELLSCETINYYLMGIQGYGGLSTVSDTQTSLLTIEANRESVVPALCTPYSSLAREGYTGLLDTLTLPYAARIARCLISEDPGQVDMGAIDGVLSVENDESINAEYDSYQGVTARKFRGKTGWYFTNSWMKGDPGEDVQYVQHRRVMDVAASTVYTTCTNWIKRPTRTNKDGTIFEIDAQVYEGLVSSAITNQLKNVKNSAGTKGHISDYKYVIDRTVNILQTKKIVATLSIQPLGYPDFIETTISFVATLA